MVCYRSFTSCRLLIVLVFCFSISYEDMELCFQVMTNFFFYSLIQQAQKFFTETNDSSDARNVC
jgi:hypothetical protein